MEPISHWIGGKTDPGESGRRGRIFNPATGEQIHEVDLASVEELGAAVAAAREAFPAWRATSLSKRADIMYGPGHQLLLAREGRDRTVAGSVDIDGGSRVPEDAVNDGGMA